MIYHFNIDYATKYYDLSDIESDPEILRLKFYSGRNGMATEGILADRIFDTGLKYNQKEEVHGIALRSTHEKAMWLILGLGKENGKDSKKVGGRQICELGSLPTQVN